MSRTETCRDCYCWVERSADLGECRHDTPAFLTGYVGDLWPRTRDTDWCRQFEPNPPAVAVLETDLAMLPQLSSHTRVLCQKLGAVSVQKILLLGRVAFQVSGDRFAALAIRELSVAMAQLGAKW